MQQRPNGCDKGRIGRQDKGGTGSGLAQQVERGEGAVLKGGRRARRGTKRNGWTETSRACVGEGEKERDKKAREGQCGGGEEGRRERQKALVAGAVTTREGFGRREAGGYGKMRICESLRIWAMSAAVTRGRHAARHRHGHTGTPAREPSACLVRVLLLRQDLVATGRSPSVALLRQLPRPRMLLWCGARCRRWLAASITPAATGCRRACWRACGLALGLCLAAAGIRPRAPKGSSSSARLLLVPWPASHSTRPALLQTAPLAPPSTAAILLTPLCFIAGRPPALRARRFGLVWFGSVSARSLAQFLPSFFFFNLYSCHASLRACVPRLAPEQACKQVSPCLTLQSPPVTTAAQTKPRARTTPYGFKHANTHTRVALRARDPKKKERHIQRQQFPAPHRIRRHRFVVAGTEANEQK